MPSSLVQRTKVFDKPFAYTIIHRQVNNFCSYCLRKPQDGKLSMCGSCKLSKYCDKSCQRLAWRDHKPECKRLKAVYPCLPLDEVLFLARAVDKIKFIKENGDVHNWQKDRKFWDLMGHEEDIVKDEAKMKHFDRIVVKSGNFLKEDMPERDEFFKIFCRVWINSHSIHTNAGVEIGMSVDLSVSKYDHHCRPTCAMVFDGFRTVFRPLVALDPDDITQAFISYCDVGRSKYQRRQELMKKWYFKCECSRCLDPEDDRLTAIKCVNPNCDEAIIITEESEPVRISCPKCHSITEPERILEAQNFMKDLPDQYSFSKSKEEVEFVKKYLDEAHTLLHLENIYLCRLLTVFAQITDNLDTSLDMHKMVYQNYRRCLPDYDRHTGFQLLHVVKSLIQQGRREEATVNAYEAMTIFEVCFGLDHPYYLQTLALWTYLDKQEKKTDDELFALMNFNYNRPVNISKILEAHDSANKDEAKKENITNGEAKKENINGVA